MASRILLADDSITIQKVVNLTFADEGIEVVAVSNGEMAERRLSEINPDLVLADIFMPGKNGYELCQYIKESPNFRHVPVVLLVGAFEPFDQAEARRVRADAHLTKPFESRTLVETVRKLIDNSKPIVTRYVPPPAPKPKPEEAPAAPRSASELPEDWLTTATREREIPSSLREESAPAQAASVPPIPAPDTFADYALSEPDVRESSPSVPVTDESELVPVSEAPAEDLLQFSRTADKSSLFVEDQGAAVPSVFGEASQDVVFDFDRTEGQPPAAANPSATAFDITSNSDLSSLGELELEAGPDATEDITSSWNLAAQDDLPVERLDSSVEAGDISPSFLITEDSIPSLGAVTDASSAFSLIEPAVDAPDSSPVFTDYDVMPVAVSEAELDTSTHDGSLWGQSTTYASSDTDMEVPETEYAEPVLLQAAQPIEIEGEKVEIPAASFTASDMWTTEEATFTPVDVEPINEVPVSESEQLPLAEEQGFAIFDYSATKQGETGFELAEVIAEESGFAIVQPRSDAPQTEAGHDSYAGSVFGLSAVSADRLAAAVQVPDVEHEPAEEVPESKIWVEPPAPVVAAVPASIELSPSVVDEIVRRVVAELSDAVVREIAWEIVPDYVERIVDRVARDALAKKAM